MKGGVWERRGMMFVRGDEGMGWVFVGWEYEKMVFV